MKKFFLTLAAMAFATSALMAQTTVTNATVQEEPDRMQMRAMSMNPSGNDIPTGYDRPQVVNQPKHECKDHKDGQPCTKPADQQCDDCKAKAAAAAKHECKKGEGQQCNKAAAKHECKKGEGQQCNKAAAKHECKKGEGQQCNKAAAKHECKKGEGQQCDKAAAAAKHECKKGEGQQCDKAAAKHECKKGEGQQCDKAAAKHECKKGEGMKECQGHKDGQACDKPADQQCPDCKKAAAKKSGARVLNAKAQKKAAGRVGAKKAAKTK